MWESADRMKAGPGTAQPESQDGPNPSAEDYEDCHPKPTRTQNGRLSTCRHSPGNLMHHCQVRRQVRLEELGRELCRIMLRAQVLQRLPRTTLKKEDGASDFETLVCVKPVLACRMGVLRLPGTAIVGIWRCSN